MLLMWTTVLDSFSSSISSSSSSSSSCLAIGRDRGRPKHNPKSTSSLPTLVALSGSGGGGHGSSSSLRQRFLQTQTRRRRMSSFSFRHCATPDHIDEPSPGPPNGHCHPSKEIEEPLHLNDSKVARLTNAETARTIVEVNNKSTLMVLGFVDDDVHEKIIWPDLAYLTDKNGDIYFEVDNDEGLLETLIANEMIVQVVIGLNNTEMLTEMELAAASVLDFGPGETSNEESDFNDDDEEDEMAIIEEEEDDDDSEMPSNWANLETMNSCHPMYFATRIAEAVSNTNVDWLDQPPASIVIEGQLRPAFVEEITMVARHRSNGEPKKDKNKGGTAFFKLEIVDIHLVTAYGDQSTVKVQDFRKAMPDIIAPSGANIVSRLRAGGEKITQALKLLCRRCKSMQVEEAVIIGVDSLGFDLRVCSGTQVQTLRFAFNTRKPAGFSKKLGSTGFNFSIQIGLQLLGEASQKPSVWPGFSFWPPEASPEA